MNKILKKEGISAEKIKNWLRENQNKRNEVFSQNRRYIFFKFEKKIYKLFTLFF